MAYYEDTLLAYFSDAELGEMTDKEINEKLLDYCPEYRLFTQWLDQNMHWPFSWSPHEERAKARKSTNLRIPGACVYSNDIKCVGCNNHCFKSTTERRFV